MPGLLEGLRVVDLSDERGFLCGRILGDLGADVIKIEPPGGDPARFQPPYVGAVADPERSITWLAYNASKRGITLDVFQPRGRAVLARLLAQSDALIESYDRAALVRAGVDYSILRAAHPRLVVCSITPFGRSGPYADYRGSDLTLCAMGGNAALTGDPDRAPLRCTMPTSHYHGGAEAAIGLLTALFARSAVGGGQHVDVSLQETMLSTIMTGGAQWWMHRQDRTRTGAGYPVGDTFQREIWHCKDGFVSFALRGGAARIPGLIATAKWLDEEGLATPAWSERDWAQYNHNNLSQAEVDALCAPLERFFAKKTMRELFTGAVARGLMLAPVNNAREIAESAQLAAREFFVRVDDRRRGIAYELPARFSLIAGTEADLRFPAPLLGEHNRDVAAELGIDPQDLQ